MSVKIKTKYSPNFDLKKRKKKNIDFLIFHYTGMRNERSAIKKLTSYKSEVSCHYFIKKNGEILNLVPDLYVAWHAGISRWKNYSSLNKNSIGIEISNSGHNFNYVNFTKNQINHPFYKSIGAYESLLALQEAKSIDSFILFLKRVGYKHNINQSKKYVGFIRC